MITGKVIIDGVDVKSAYGAYIVDGGYDDVPSFPDMKSPEKNEWFESNSVEIDLESPVVESQKMSLRFMMNGTVEKLQSFVDFIMSKIGVNKASARTMCKNGGTVFTNAKGEKQYYRKGRDRP